MSAKRHIGRGLGPLFVIIGAALWGTETYFRVDLNKHFDSEILVFHEHLFCILFTLPVYLISRPSFRLIPVRSWIYLILSGVIGSAIGTLLFTLSLRTLNPSVANVLLNFQPIVSVVFASLLLHERIHRDFVLWATIALMCGLAIVLGDYANMGKSPTEGYVYITITALAWGFSTVAGRGAMLKIPLALATLGRFTVGLVTMFVSLVINGKFTYQMLQWEAVPLYWRDFSNLSLLAGVVPLFFYFKGLQNTSASVGGFCELTQTFSALILTWGLMGNPLTWVQVVAGLVLMISVYMTNLAHAKANIQGVAV